MCVCVPTMLDTTRRRALGSIEAPRATMGLRILTGITSFVHAAHDATLLRRQVEAVAFNHLDLEPWNSLTWLHRESQGFQPESFPGNQGWFSLG